MSVIGIFRGIHTAKLPSVHPSFFIAFEIELNYAETNKDFPMRIELVDADGNKILEVGATLKFEGPGKIGDKPRFAHFIRVNGLRFNRAGAHDLNIFLGSDLKHQSDLTVHLVQEGPQSPPGQLSLPSA